MLVGCGENNSPVISPTPTPYQTIKFIDDGTGWLRFYNNDPQYNNYLFYRFSDITIDPFTTMDVDINCIKATNQSFGIVFCIQGTPPEHCYLFYLNKPNPDTEPTKFNYYFLIDRNGSSEPDGTVFCTNNIINLKVTRDDSTNLITLFINNSAVKSFNDSTYTKGYEGFYVGLINQLSTEVDLKFKLNTPNLSGSSKQMYFSRFGK